MHYTLFIKIDDEIKLIFSYDDIIEAITTASSLAESHVGSEKFRVFIEVSRN